MKKIKGRRVADSVSQFLREVSITFTSLLHGGVLERKILVIRNLGIALKESKTLSNHSVNGGCGLPRDRGTCA